MSPANKFSALNHLRVSLCLGLAIFPVAALDTQAQTSNVTGDPAAKPLRSFGTSGKAVYPFTQGAATEAELFTHQGKGCLTHMWFGGKWKDYERMRIRVYVDGETKASIDMELFLGHGIGYKDEAGPWGTKRIGKTGQPSGIYNFTSWGPTSSIWAPTPTRWLA